MKTVRANGMRNWHAVTIAPSPTLSNSVRWTATAYGLPWLGSDAPKPGSGVELIEEDFLILLVFDRVP
jgi:hypothetical protein